MGCKLPHKSLQLKYGSAISSLPEQAGNQHRQNNLWRKQDDENYTYAEDRDYDGGDSSAEDKRENNNDYARRNAGWIKSETTCQRRWVDDAIRTTRTTITRMRITYSDSLPNQTLFVAAGGRWKQLF